MALGLALASQFRFQEAMDYFDHSRVVLEAKLDDIETRISYIRGFKGFALFLQGRFAEGAKELHTSLEIREQFRVAPDMPEILVWLGHTYSTQGEIEEAQKWYHRCLNLRWTKRQNFISDALSGLIRVKHAQHDYAAIPSFLDEAEQLAQQYEYNDHLASLRLTQGHIAWDGHIPEWGNGFDAAFGYYKLALVYALRFNRFLLDEVLSGRPQGTPLRPIIPECLKRSEDGQKMLRALSDWWQTGKNDVGAPRPDTISPIPENIALLEAEKIAREREPGDGSAQKSVVEQIETALKQF